MGKRIQDIQRAVAAYAEEAPATGAIGQERCYCWSVELPHVHSLGDHGYVALPVPPRGRSGPKRARLGGDGGSKGHDACGPGQLTNCTVHGRRHSKGKT